MARKISNTIEFFQHYANKQSRTIAKLESKYGNDGYAFFFRLLEMLASTENHCLDLSESNDMDYFAMRMRINTDVCEKILADLVNWKKIDKQLWEEHRGVWYEKFVSNHSHVYEKRKRKLPANPVIPATEMQAEPDSCHRNATITAIPVPESTHSIVEYSRAQNSIVENISFKKETKEEQVPEVENPEPLTAKKEKPKEKSCAKKEKVASEDETALTPFEMFTSVHQIWPATKRTAKTDWVDFEKKYKKEFSTEFFRAIFRGVQSKIKHHRHLESINAKFIPEWPHFKTYLNQRRWEEQLDTNLTIQTNGTASGKTNQQQSGSQPTGAELAYLIAS